MADVMLVCMPFGPVFSPSLALSLLKAGLSRQGIAARVLYFSIDFAERIGQDFYSGVATYSRPPHRELAGEWVFSRALFGAAVGDGEAYLREILQKPRRASHDRPVTPGLLRKLRHARGLADEFLDWCLDEVLRERPRIVGFTSVFHQHVASLALARRIKQRLPECFIVMGGANCEGPMGAETVRSFPFVDATVSGEADLVFPLLVQRVLAGQSASGLPGVQTIETASRELPLATTASAPLAQDMDALPIPDYADYFARFGRTRYAKEWQPSIFFETSRGCWWGERQHCTFCGLNGTTMTFRSKSAGRALDELRTLTQRHPGCDVQLTDNILDLAYFKDLVPALAESGLGVELFYETKSNLRKDQVRMLRRAGITRIQPGIESLSDAVLKLMRKGVTALQNIQLLKWCKELGLEPHWNILSGFAGEPPEEYGKMARLVPLLTHLPAPTGWGGIRLDRFSPNFFDAERLGFTDVTPSPPYAHIYPLPQSALRNLAYFFSFAYKEPQDVAAYVLPLARQIGKWKRLRGRSELLAVPTRDGLVLFDSRPAARAPITVLRDLDRTLYEACDAISNLGALAASAERAGQGPVAEETIAQRLDELVRAGLMLADGGRYLALAVRLGEYVPTRDSADSLYAIAQKLGRRTAREVIIPLAPSRERGGARSAARARRRIPRRHHWLTPEAFRLRPGELVIRLET